MKAWGHVQKGLFAEMLLLWYKQLILASTVRSQRVTVERSIGSTPDIP